MVDVEHSHILTDLLRSGHLTTLRNKMSCSLSNALLVGSGTGLVPKQRPSLRPLLSTQFPGALSRRGWRAKMVGPVRPQFVLFGSSIVQFSFEDEGWGASLTNLYARQADIILRGYGGWNSNQALEVLDQVFPQDSIPQPSLAIVYFGGNDAIKWSPNPLNPHVPLDKFSDNMSKIAAHIKGLSPTTRSIFLTPPPVNSEQIKEKWPGMEKYRTMEDLEQYANAVVDVCRKLHVECIDLFRVIQKRDNWLTFFRDGIHFNEAGSRVVFEEIEQTLNRANWVPSLAAGSMPIEFKNVKPLMSSEDDSEGLIWILD